MLGQLVGYISPALIVASRARASARIATTALATAPNLWASVTVGAPGQRIKIVVGGFNCLHQFDTELVGPADLAAGQG
jgi:hypothetical protein